MQLFVRNTLSKYSASRILACEHNCRLIYYNFGSILIEGTNSIFNDKIIKYVHSPSEEMYE